MSTLSIKQEAGAYWLHCTADSGYVESTEGPFATMEQAQAALEAAQQPRQLFAVRGRARWPVASLEAAAAKWDAFRDAALKQGGGGVSEVGNGVEVVDQDGKLVGRVSYNGRIWPVRRWVVSTPEEQLGIYEATSADEAIEMFARAHGHADYRAMCAALGDLDLRTYEADEGEQYP